MQSDRSTQRRVLATLELDPGLDASQIGVTVHNGVVTLHGAVTTWREHDEAERTVASVRGVRAIANELEVRVAGGSIGTDADIAESIADVLGSSRGVPEDTVHVSVQDGVVTLTGEVGSRHQLDAAQDQIRRLPGVKRVANLVALTQRHSSDEESSR